MSCSFRVLVSWKRGIRLASDALDPTVRIWFAARHHGEQFFPHGDAHFPLLDWRQFKSFVIDGIWHIWTGPDHLLFILSLLLPSVLICVRRPRTLRWL